MLIAPSEPASLRSLGTYSPLPESLGVDYLIPCPIGMVGIQRKEIHDLIASRNDGRLSKELAQMKQLDVAILLIEGRIRWTSDGQLLSSHSRWTRSEHHGMLFSIQSTGIWVNSSADLMGSKEYLAHAEKWFTKATHQGLNTRPKPQTMWGQRTDRDWAIHVIQSFDGIGPGVAGNIVDKYGLPLRWTVSREELEMVPGIGKRRANKLWGTLNGDRS